MHTTVTEFLVSPQTCLFLVSPDMRKLEDAANELVALYDWPRLPVGQELSEALLSESPQHRPHTANRWIKARLSEMAPGPVLCAETDLLFELTLKLDPLRLMRDASKVTRLIVAWSASYTNNVLTYAVPEHGHYRTWRNPGVAIAVLK